MSNPDSDVCISNINFLFSSSKSVYTAITFIVFNMFKPMVLTETLVSALSAEELVSSAIYE